MRLLLFVAALFLAMPAFAEDPCAGRNPLYCRPAPGPIVVESVRVKPRGSIATTHDTIVSRDGKVLLVIKGKLNQYNLSDTKTRKELGYGE